MSSSDGYDPATNMWTIHGVVFTDEFFQAFTTEMPSPDIYFRVTRIDEHGQPIVARRYYTLPAEPLPDSKGQAAKIARRPWLNRLLLMPCFFWCNYQVGKSSISRRYRLIAAIHMTWLMTQPDWMRQRMAPPRGSHGGSMRLDEGRTMRGGFSDGPSTPKPSIAPRGQGGGYQPVNRSSSIISPPRTP